MTLHKQCIKCSRPFGIMTSYTTKDGLKVEVNINNTEYCYTCSKKFKKGGL